MAGDKLWRIGVLMRFHYLREITVNGGAPDSI
jgi:hypothetical protein